MPMTLYPVVKRQNHSIALPVFAWEVSVAIWMIAKGFRPSAIAAIGSPGVDGKTPLPLG
jgi:hypothetical protein